MRQNTFLSHHCFNDEYPYVREQPVAWKKYCAEYWLTISKKKPWFLRVYRTNLLKTLWEKEKLLVTSNFSFSHSISYPFQELSAIFIKFKTVVSKLFQFGRVQNLSFGKELKHNRKNIGHCYISEIILKTALNTKLSINQSKCFSTRVSVRFCCLVKG